MGNVQFPYSKMRRPSGTFQKFRLGSTQRSVKFVQASWRSLVQSRRDCPLARSGDLRREGQLAIARPMHSSSSSEYWWFGFSVSELAIERQARIISGDIGAPADHQIS